MKKILIIIFSFCFSYIYAQQNIYKLDNIIQYRIKSDFYFDFLNIYSTKDYQTSLLVMQTPVGNFASLKIDDNLYAVYAKKKENTNFFKIDFEGTKDLLGYAYYLTDNPSLSFLNTSNSFTIKKENKEETILDKKCDVYSIISQEEETEICIDTNSSINTLPLINNEINLKGLVYRIGQSIILEKIDLLENVLKEYSETDNENRLAIDDFTFQFDEKAEIEEYKKQYNKNKEQPSKN